jgi:hypothetical protein
MCARAQTQATKRIAALLAVEQQRCRKSIDHSFQNAIELVDALELGAFEPLRLVNLMRLDVALMDVDEGIETCLQRFDLGALRIGDQNVAPVQASAQAWGGLHELHVRCPPYLR